MSTDRILPEEDNTNLSEIVHQAIGAASTCWEHLDGTGIFDDARARQIADELIAFIKHRGIDEIIMVEIGGQRMTQAQFDAARYPLLHPAPKLNHICEGFLSTETLYRNDHVHCPICFRCIKNRSGAKCIPEVIAWAIKWENGDIHIPYPGGFAPGSREVVDQTINGNPSRNTIPVPLGIHPSFYDKN